MNDANIILEREGPIATVTLDRSGRLHAFNDEMFDKLVSGEKLA